MAVEDLPRLLTLCRSLGEGVSSGLGGSVEEENFCLSLIPVRATAALHCLLHKQKDTGRQASREMSHCRLPWIPAAQHAGDKVPRPILPPGLFLVFQSVSWEFSL